MKKYLFVFVALIAFLGISNASAQENKIIEVSECTPSRLTVEGSTLISTGYGHLILPEMDYSNYTGVNFEASNFERLDENATKAVCSLKIEYTEEGKTVKATMGFYKTGKKKIEFKSFKDDNKGIISIAPLSITKISIGMGKNKKVDINNIVLIAQ